MKVLVVTGSPRRGGNSDLMAQAFAEGAEQAGCEVHRFDAGRAKIAGCLGCEFCFSHEGECCQKDDMEQVKALLYEVDAVVFATPVYWYSWPAQIKAFLDRTFCGMGKPFSFKKTALLACYEDKVTTPCDCLVQCYREAAKYAGWENLGEVCVGKVYKKGDVEQTDALDRCRALGASMG